MATRGPPLLPNEARVGHAMQMLRLILTRDGSVGRAIPQYGINVSGDNRFRRYIWFTVTVYGLDLLNRVTRVVSVLYMTSFASAFVCFRTVAQANIGRVVRTRLLERLPKSCFGRAAPPHKPLAAVSSHPTGIGCISCTIKKVYPLSDWAPQVRN